MTKYNFINSLYLSFYSVSLYQDVAKNWKGRCFGYLLFILCLFWIPEVSRIHTDVSAFFSAEAPKYLKQMPAITISQGKVSINEKVPYFIFTPATNKPFAIIDTSGQISSLERTTASLLVTDSKLIIKKDSTDFQVFDLEGIDRLIVDQKVLNDWIGGFISIFPVILFPFLLLYSFLYHIIQVFLSAGIGVLFAKKLQTDLTYKTLIRLSAVSFTPAIMLQIIHAVFDIPFPYRAPISFLISLGYLYYAVGSNSGTALFDGKLK